MVRHDMLSKATDVEQELTLFRSSIDRFFERHATPEVVSSWREAGVVDRNFWRLAGQAGLLGLSIDPEYGGPGAGFLYEAELARAIYERGLDVFAAPLHNAIVAPYLQSYGTDAQKRRWLPGCVSGEYILAIAMTEPGAGSDLQSIQTLARRDGDAYVISGQKTFISSGQLANLLIVVCTHERGAGKKAMSLFVVETDKVQGFRRGRKLEKIGLEAADTSELFFDDVRVGADALLGEVESCGFAQLSEKLPQERLLIAVQGLGTIDRALKETLDYVKTRRAFGRALFDFQNTQFKLAECKTEATIAKVFVDHCIQLHLCGELDAATASMAKYWVTERQCAIVDECLQLHGGYGYMLDYPIARMYRDSRIQKIYGGANEIMKMLIARSL